MTATLNRDALLALANDLDAATNLWGEPLGEQARARVFAVVTDPTEATWEQAHGLIISRRLTLWQATVKFAGYPIILHDGPWPCVPTTAQLMTALHIAAEVDH